jgi:threonine dehydrogenase-like Zn-dependent dehydrogenase
VFRHSLAREAASAIGGRVDRRAFVSRFAPVRIEDVPELPLPAADWVRVRTTFSGLCGSDVKQILLNGSRANPLTALVSFPHVLGHEVVGRRLDTDERVVLNPWLSCVPRGISPVCSACADGRYPWCRSFRSGDLPVSIHLGNCAAEVRTRSRRRSGQRLVRDDPAARAHEARDPAQGPYRVGLMHQECRREGKVERPA